MGLFASEFIESKREILNEKGVSFWSDEILFFTLAMAYTSVQKDLPYFTHMEIIQSEKDEWKYRTSKPILQPISVSMDGKPYTVVTNQKFFNDYGIEHGICTAYEEALCLSKAPLLDAQIIDVRYKYLHRLETIDCEIMLPEHYMEALHYNFLSKVWEKNPKRESRTLVNAYKQDYALELLKLQKWGKVKARKIRTKHKKV